jgi:ATP synthase protein I
MTRDNPQDEPADDSDRLGDPWAAFGYLVAGVGFYGLVGWGLSVWLHATWLIPVGILTGAGLGLYLVYARLGKIPKPTGGRKSLRSPDASSSSEPHGFSEPPSTTRPDGPPRPPSDDRGDTE